MKTERGSKHRTPPEINIGHPSVSCEIEEMPLLIRENPSYCSPWRRVLVSIGCKILLEALPDAKKKTIVVPNCLAHL